MTNITSVGKFFAGKFDQAIHSSFMTKQLDKGLKDPASFAAKMMVYSLVSKDAVNCAIYTYQSAKNEKIPKEKRSFVASLDLINGILNVAGQLFAFSIVEKIFTPKEFGKHFSGTLKDGTALDGETKKALLLSDNMQEVVKDVLSKDPSKSSNPKLINKIKGLLENGEKKFDFAKFNSLNAEEKQKSIDGVVEMLNKGIGKGSDKFKAIEKGFGLLVSALATTALVKRTLVPLIATPLAGSLSEYVDKKKKNTPKDRMYYETAAVAAGKYDNKMDKTAFSNFSSQNK